MRKLCGVLPCIALFVGFCGCDRRTDERKEWETYWNNHRCDDERCGKAFVVGNPPISSGISKCDDAWSKWESLGKPGK